MDNGFALYKEVFSNLKEGLRFYGDLSKLLQDVRDACKHVSHGFESFYQPDTPRKATLGAYAHHTFRCTILVASR